MDAAACWGPYFERVLYYVDVFMEPSNNFWEPGYNSERPHFLVQAWAGYTFCYLAGDLMRAQVLCTLWWISVTVWLQQSECLDEGDCLISAEWMLLHECCGHVLIVLWQRQQTYFKQWLALHESRLIWKEIVTVFHMISHISKRRELSV